MEIMYLPNTGKNFQPWKLPHVATYKPLAAVCGEMMKSELDVKASLYKVSIWNGFVSKITYQQMRCFSMVQCADFFP